jgi:hypothetical protein
MSISWEIFLKAEIISAILERYPDPAGLIKSCAAPTWEEVSDKMVEAVKSEVNIIPMLPEQPEGWLMTPVDDKIELLSDSLFECIDLTKNFSDGSRENSDLRKSLFKILFFLVKQMEDQHDRRANLAEKILQWNIVAGPEFDEED